MSLLRVIALLLLLIPVVELFVLVKLGGVIGALPTVFLVVFSAVLGVLLVRTQGIATLWRVRTALARGEVPAIPVLEGVVVVIGGLLLVIPGVLTDAVGLLCLLPQVRQRMIVAFLRRTGVIAGRRGNAPARPDASRTLEREYWRDEDRR